MLCVNIRCVVPEYTVMDHHCSLLCNASTLLCSAVRYCVVQEYTVGVCGCVIPEYAVVYLYSTQSSSAKVHKYVIPQYTGTVVVSGQLTHCPLTCAAGRLHIS